ncbi:hypothetical protein AB595_17620 [Massilia sp. WF1]|uniref:hypothetical protein n=1 Tax=unclassified Massilia TaxID=2609279 RepID=UPI00064B61B7|nr:MULTISPECIES: hypothetical protein [unclassified Massilia]ALK98089.1 hypothetical protein AM586_19755 [Massilia sp. WG5]KLU35562.1 hypothetical protein AB595_17620 [Massilia sp. WF1]
MRALFIAIPVSLLLTASHAVAQSQSHDYPLTDSTSGSTVFVTAPPKAIFVAPSDTDSIKGAYAMSNGWRLDVKSASKGIVARIDDQRPMRLIAVAPDRFVTADGNVEMQFNQGDFGDDMTMSYVPSSRVAERITIRSTLAAR